MQTNQPLSPTEVLKIIENYELMFVTDGWKELVEDIKEKDKTLFPSLMQKSAGEAELQFAKGRHDVFTYIMNLEQMVMETRRQLELQTETGPNHEDVV